MKFKIVHDTPGRIRLRCGGYYFDKNQEKSLEKTILSEHYVDSVKAKSVNGGILITYQSDYRQELLNYIKGIKQNQLAAVEDESEDIQADFKNEIIKMLIKRFVLRRILPYPVRVAMAYFKAFPYVKKAVGSVLNLRADVALLDGVALGTALSRGMYSEVNSITFLLGVSELLEEYTRKRTKNALADSLAMKIDTVWKKNGENEEQVPISTVKEGDFVVFRDGAMITFDGVVVSGQASVNEASMTGESVAAVKDKDSTVYAGTVVEAGNIVIKVSAAADNTRISNIIEMIENGESMKAGVQSRAEKIADGFVPYSLGLALLVYLTTRNVVKAMSVLMVDYSCAIKLSTPISIISAMREASSRGFVVKGGRYLESVSHADTIVFDKTGTLTNSCPTVEKVLSFGEYTSDEILKIAACLEEHFPHSVAKAIVKAAKSKQLDHEEEHAEVEYVVAHGIATMLHGKRAIIGSEHFVLEDENIPITDEQKSVIENECEGFSVIYLAIGGVLSGVIYISDPPRSEAHEAIQLLRESGIDNIIMLTGDHEGAAKRTADMLGIDNFRAQVLPEDKATIIEELKNEGRTVIMVGDGINDSPALALSDVSIAMKDSADLAREVADVTLLSGDLRDLALLRKLSSRLFRRIKRNYTFIMAFNSLLILLGLKGTITPSASSLLHNSSTMLISANSMRPLLKDKN